MSMLSTRIHRYPWIWSYVAIIAAFVAMTVISHHLSFGDLTVNLGLAGFLVVAGLGQVFAITGGGGGIDLSVPSVLTMSAMVSTAVTHGASGSAVEGIAAALAVGLAIGALNGGLIVGLRLPPIVATLSTGFVLESFIQLYYAQAEAGAPSPVMAAAVRGDVLGLPTMLWVAVAATVVAGWVLQSTVYGRHLEAAGQNADAAELTHIHVDRVRFASYLISAAMAAVTGILLSAYAGGAFMDMGTSYQLGSIAAVVLGGSLIAGGKSTAAGVFGGAVLLTFLVTLMSTTGLTVGLRDILEGAIIILVLALGRSS